MPENEMEQRNCQNCKQTFSIDSDDAGFYQQMSVPPPTFCPLCRAKRRLSWRNERNLYKRPSDFSKKDIFTMYPPEVPVKVYEKDVWNSDEWDPLDYGREYDFSRPFFEQFKELLHATPLKNLNVVNGVNSDYTNNFTDPKNCYLVFNGNNSEDTCYGNGLTAVKDCVDVSHVGKSETCYECFWMTSCNRCVYSSRCEDSYNLAFCSNCVGCHDCVGCAGLRKKSYCIFNVQYSKEEYEKKVKEFGFDSYKSIQEFRKKAKEFWLKFPNKYIEGSHNQNVSGNYIDHCKNVRNCFLVREGENLRYCQYVQELPGSKDCWDYSIWGDGNRFVYECCASGINTNMIKFSMYVQENVHDIEYSYCCSSSAYLFGCVGIKRKQYCILNKQYSKEEYEALAPKIREHMKTMPYTDKKGRVYAYGEFFPTELSPIPYNQSVAQEYFPLTEEETAAQGYAWRDPVERSYKITVAPEELPDKIRLVSDEILKEVIGCEHTAPPAGGCQHQCATAFRIVPQELQFYRKTNIPLPHLCPNCRHAQRIEQRTKFELFQRKCQCAGGASENGAYANTVSHAHGTVPCRTEFETAYPPDSPDIVYCESCYQSEVI